jgi:hypothetical protein
MTSCINMPHQFDRAKTSLGGPLGTSHLDFLEPSNFEKS